MNIFFVDRDPVVAAQSLCDQHVVKMPLESAIMLCAPHDNPPYKRAWLKHPCTIWASSSFQNYCWLTDHGLALCDEYTFRFGKIHKSRSVIEWCLKHRPLLQLPMIGLTEPALAMWEEFRGDDPVQSYRDYYLGPKREFARWNNGRNPPVWWS